MSDKPKILVLIDWYLPGYKAGGTLRACANLIENLQTDFDFDVVTRDTDYMESEPYEDIKANEWIFHENNVRIYYISKDRLRLKTIKEHLRISEYEFVYLSGMYSRYFTIYPLYYLALVKKFPNIILAPRGMLGLGAWTRRPLLKKMFLHFFKFIGVYKPILFQASGEEEHADIMNRFGVKTNVKIAADLTSIKDANKFPEREKLEGEANFIFVGRISKEKNIKYLLERLHGIKGKLHLEIYGAMFNTEYWAECKLIIEGLPSNVSVTYKGEFEYGEVDEILRKHHFLALPSPSENFGHAILEALSSACPVIISDNTPWKGLKNKEVGWDIPLSDQSQFENTLETCLAMDQETYRHWSKKAREYAMTYLKDRSARDLNKALFQ